MKLHLTAHGNLESVKCEVQIIILIIIISELVIKAK